MEIDWFWLAVIIAIISLAIVITIENYFSYKSSIHGCSKKKDNKKEDKPNEE